MNTITENVSKIDRTKRDIVLRICQNAEDNEIIDRIIVFGSAATQTCTGTSDLDVCFDVNCGTRDMRVFDLNVRTARECEHNCDIVFYNYIGSNLKDEIDRKGIVVYEAG